MPNISYNPNRSMGFLLQYFFTSYLRFEFGKNANSINVNIGVKSILRKICLATVGVCVFRALISIGALFYFSKNLVYGGKL